MRSRSAHKKAAPRRDHEHKPRREDSPEADREEGSAASNRIAKVIARAGVCSRRDAEAWIGEGRVTLNGEVLTNPAINVSDSDAITIDGAPLAQRERTRLFLFHKPRGLVTTERDPEGRPTIFDYLRENWPEGPRVVSIGRLDINTEGLLLLTNDGGLARVLELPTTGWVRRYRVRAKGETDQSILDGLRQGVTIEGVEYAGIEATLDRVQGANSWLTMGLREGKNREIKRVLEHIGLEVNRLIRLSFGPFQLGETEEGAIEEVRTRVLRDQLGPSLAEAAGADFLSPAGADAEAAQDSKAMRQRRAPTKAGSERDGGASPRQARSRQDQPREMRAREPRQREREPLGPAKGKPAPRPRKHISALRAEESLGQSGPRKRVERCETADRSGRVVQVERLSSTASQDKRQDTSNPVNTRNGRRFAAERKDRNRESDRSGRPAAPLAAGKVRRKESASQLNQERNREDGKRSANPRKPSGFASGEARPGRPRARSEGDAKPRRNGEGERSWSQGRKTPDREHAPTRGDERPGSAKPFRGRSSSPKSATFSGKPARGAGPNAARPRNAGAAAGLRSKDKRPGGKTGGPARPGKGRPRDKH